MRIRKREHCIAATRYGGHIKDTKCKYRKVMMSINNNKGNRGDLQSAYRSHFHYELVTLAIQSSTSCPTASATMMPSSKTCRAFPATSTRACPHRVRFVVALRRASWLLFHLPSPLSSSLGGVDPLVWHGWGSPGASVDSPKVPWSPHPTVLVPGLTPCSGRSSTASRF
jgi:hypothetical protein